MIWYENCYYRSLMKHIFVDGFKIARESIISINNVQTVKINKIINDEHNNTDKTRGNENGGAEKVKSGDSGTQKSSS